MGGQRKAAKPAAVEQIARIQAFGKNCDFFKPVARRSHIPVETHAQRLAYFSKNLIDGSAHPANFP